MCLYLQCYTKKRHYITQTLNMLKKEIQYLVKFRKNKKTGLRGQAG